MQWPSVPACATAVLSDHCQTYLYMCVVSAYQRFRSARFHVNNILSLNCCFFSVIAFIIILIPHLHPVLLMQVLILTSSIQHVGKILLTLLQTVHHLITVASVYSRFRTHSRISLTTTWRRDCLHKSACTIFCHMTTSSRLVSCWECSVLH